MTKLMREEEGYVAKCGMARLVWSMRYHSLDERSRR